ncbi:hypothetical protein HYV64_01820 [Candidatus Shapirobacteria bacterium]|nr:hypothetical protein [Candidatus Shapirobacteria bacterium]
MMVLDIETISATLGKSVEKDRTTLEGLVMSTMLELSTQYPKGLGLAADGDNFLLVSPHVDSHGEVVLATETGVYILEQDKLDAKAHNLDRIVGAISGAITTAKQLVAKIPQDDYESHQDLKDNGLFINAVTQVNIADKESPNFQKMVELVKDMSKFRASIDSARLATTEK